MLLVTQVRDIVLKTVDILVLGYLDDDAGVDTSLQQVGNSCGSNTVTGVHSREVGLLGDAFHDAA